MTDENLKITDKRMFTPDGELREEYRHLEESRAAAPPPEENRAVAGEEAPAPEEPSSPSAEAQRGEAADERPAAAVSDPPPAADAAQPERERSPATPGSASRTVVFEDLVGLLAEHAAISLGDAPLPDGQSMLDLRVAQMHIDLLDVLREKTKGNLTEQQASLLEDLLYRLRLVYVEKSRESG